jgi:hypothetical protein
MKNTLLPPHPIRLRQRGATAVNHPSHYTFGRFEVVDVLMDWFPRNPLLWQVGKYIARAEHKGKALEDLQKARVYLDWEIKRLEKTCAK